MKRNTIHALLLSFIVMTGVITMTTNAFAQTNTERLTEVVDNTRSANTMLDSIQELLTSLVSDVMEAIAALAANIEAMSTSMSEEFDAVDDAISHVDEEVSALDSKVMMLDSALMDISTQVSSVGDQVAAFDQRDGQMDIYYQDHIDDFAVILPAIKETVDGLAASQSDTSLESISEGISANAARINEITSSLEAISVQVSTIQEKLDIVANTTATTSAQTRAPLTGPGAGSATLMISPYDIAKNVNDDGDMATVTYTFMCEEDIFLDQLARVGEGNPGAIADLGTGDTRTSITVGASSPVLGMLYNSAFSVTGATGDTVLDKAISGSNTPLLASKTLTITLTADSNALGNTIAITNGTGTAANVYLESEDPGNEAGTTVNTLKILADNLKEDLYWTDGNADNEQMASNKVSAQTLMPTIYTLKVSWISDAEDPKCGFMRTDATTDTSTANIGFSSQGDDVLNKDTKILNCNGVDTTIVSINPIMTGDLKHAATLKFLDSDDEPSAVFGFDVNGTHSLKDGYKDALPLDLGGDNLTIEAELSTVTTLFLQVEYQSADGNKCRATDN